MPTEADYRTACIHFRAIQREARTLHLEDRERIAEQALNRNLDHWIEATR